MSQVTRYGGGTIIHWGLDDDDGWDGAEFGWGKDTVRRCGALGIGPGEVVG